MSIVLSAAVMTHPRRLASALALRERHPDLDLAIVVDPEPAGPPHSLRTARLAWQAVGDNATHHLVVQDDMLLVDCFARRVRAAAAALPGQILCFFTEWGSRSSHAVRLATIEGASWVPVIDPYVPTTAVLLPADIARDLAKRATHEMDPDDVVLLRYVRENGLVPYLSAPNLAQHQSSESLVGNDLIVGPRRAALYAGRLADPPDLDATVSRLTVVPHLLMFEGISVCHVRDSPFATGWRTIKTHEYVEPFGLSVPDLLDRFGAAMSTVDAERRIRAVVGEPLLLQAWLTVFAYGMAAAGVVTDLGALDRPLVAEGLRTLVPGMLKRFVPEAELDDLPDLVGRMVHSAIRSGFSIVKSLH